MQELTLGFSIENEEYIVGYMDGECLPANMYRKINKRHQKTKKECLEMINEANVLYDIKNNL